MSSPDEIWLTFVRKNYSQVKQAVEQTNAHFFLYRNMLSSIWKIEMTPNELEILTNTLQKYLHIVEQD